MIATLLITVDTNVIDVDSMNELRAAVTIPHEFAYVDVTEDERSLEEIKLTGDYEAPVAGVFVLDDAVSGVLDGSRVLAGDGIGNLLPDALGIISGGFSEWETANAARWRQHRDAQIFEAHARSRRHVLVTNDATGFVNFGKREALEQLGQTRILLVAEFLALARAGGLETLLP